MSTPETTGMLEDGRAYRVTNYAVEIYTPDGQRAEELDLQYLQDVRRDGHAVVLRFPNGGTRVLSAATIEDAGRLQDLLRSRVRPRRTPPPVQPLPPSTTQSVQVGSSRSPLLSVIIGIAVLVLIIVVINGLQVGDSDGPTTPQPTEVPAAPTEAPEEPTTSGSVPNQFSASDSSTGVDLDYDLQHFAERGGSTQREGTRV